MRIARLYYRLVKFEHTIFALPFAYVGAFLAVDGVPSAHDLLWITLAMVGARSLAMALNRLIDARIDAANPRTATRELPSGALSVAAVLVFCASALVLYGVSVWQLDPFVRWLSPIPVAAFVVYPYLKRFTWLCHLWLGAVDGLAPVGAWAAIKGELPWQAWALGAAVAAWVAGFDLFYALFDVDVDRGQGLHSWATRFGERGAFAGARALHLATIVLLVAAGARPARRHSLLGRRRDRRRAPPLRALARPARRRAPARRGVLHDERRHLGGVLRIRARGRPVIVGLLHPGEMGAAVGDHSRRTGTRCCGPPTVAARRRARAPAFRDVGARRRRLPGESRRRALDLPAARGARRRAARRRNSPASTSTRTRSRRAPRVRLAALHRVRRRRHRRRPAARARDTRCTSPARAAEVASLFAGSLLETRLVADASALKMAYAAWSKGTAALLLATARSRGTSPSTRRSRRVGGLGAGPARGLERAERSAATKGWRWAGEMDEIADTFAAAGQPEGFHRAAAEVYRA